MVVVALLASLFTAFVVPLLTGFVVSSLTVLVLLQSFMATMLEGADTLRRCRRDRRLLQFKVDLVLTGGQRAAILYFVASTWAKERRGT